MTAVTRSLSLPIQGMSCASCVSHVEGALKDLPGTTDVVVNLGTNKATLTYDPARATLADMIRAVDDVGYAVAKAELTLQVSGMTCASCVSHVEGAWTELDGVTGAVVNLGLGTARVTYIPGVVTISGLRRARADEITRQGRSLLVAGTIGLIVMIGTFYDMIGALKAFVPIWFSHNLSGRLELSEEVKHDASGPLQLLSRFQRLCVRRRSLSLKGLKWLL